MNKRITSLLLAVVMICSMLTTAVPAYAAPGDSGVSASVTEASPGDTFTVTLKVPGTAKQISDMSLKVLFDNTIFEVTEYTIPSISGMSKMQSTVAEANSNGFFSATYDSESSDADVTFTGIELTATFKVKDGAAINTCEFKLDTSVVVGSLTEEGFPDLLMTYDDFVNKSVSVQVTAAPKPATGIELNKSTTTIYTGANETLIATVEPIDTTDTVTWESSNTAVATVDTDGKVTAVATGTATITAKAGSQSAACVVTVENAPCTHTNKTNVDAKTSTCKEKGWEAYSKCDDCKQLFDKDGNEISNIPYLSLADHTPTQTADLEYLKTAATCTSAAVYYKHCSVCDEKLDTTFEDGSPSSHKVSGWKSDKDGHWKECEDCHTITDAKEDHTPDRTAATEDDPIKCTKCEYTIAPALGHTHSLTKVNAEDPTCTTAGNDAYYVCSGCEKWFEDATGAVEITDHDSVVIKALDHDWAAATCTAPKTCKRDGCGATEGIALGHNYAAVWSSDASKHWHECTRCSDRADEAAHTSDIAAATCTTPVKCTYCDATITPAKGHSMSKIDAVDATCTTAGAEAYYVCSDCGKWFEDAAGTAEITDHASVVIAALGHDWEAATCTAPKTCKRCGATEGTALGHDYAAAWSSNAAEHWHACTRCDDKTELAAHEFGADDVCDICGYKKAAVPSYDGDDDDDDDYVSSTKDKDDMSGRWIQNEHGWWYCYDNDTWPSSRWLYLPWNGAYYWYYFNAEGYMETGWLDWNGNRYYLNPVVGTNSGKMLTGWQCINGTWFYFNPVKSSTEGAMFRNTTTPDGYQVGADGAWIQ